MSEHSAESDAGWSAMTCNPIRWVRQTRGIPWKKRRFAIKINALLAEGGA